MKLASEETASIRRSIRRHELLGYAVSFIVVGGFGGWATTTEIDGAVIASGVLSSAIREQQVQHPNGGVVGEILFREGDRVDAGQVLLRLDATTTSANLRIIIKRFTELIARQARLEAERDGLEEIAFPDIGSLELSDLAEFAHAANSERRLFEVRREARLGEKAQLEQRSLRIEQEIDGLEAQRSATLRESALLAAELANSRSLLAKGLARSSDTSDLERQAVRLESELGSILASIARARTQIAETAIQSAQIDRALATEVAQELRDTAAAIGEFSERRLAAENEMRLTDIRAPMSGVVNASTASTVGGVIAPGATILQIVPVERGVTVEAKVRPDDIDQVRSGQSVTLRLVAFNQNKTPELLGRVVHVPPALTVDDFGQGSFYSVRVAPLDGEIDRLGDRMLVPGMPVEVLIRTESRTVLNYFIQPFLDQLNQAFRQ